MLKVIIEVRRRKKTKNRWYFSKYDTIKYLPQRNNSHKNIYSNSKILQDCSHLKTPSGTAKGQCRGTNMWMYPNTTTTTTTDWQPGLGLVQKDTNTHIQEMSSLQGNIWAKEEQGGRSHQLNQCPLWDSSRLILKPFDLRGLSSKDMRSLWERKVWEHQQDDVNREEHLHPQQLQEHLSFILG